MISLYPRTLVPALALCALAFSPVYAEVQELSNTEMTEAYIEDGGIVVKQKAKPAIKVQKTQSPKVKLNIRPGEPHISEAEVAQQKEQNYQSESNALLLEMQRDTTTQQLQQNQLSEQNALVTIPVMQSEAALAQRAHAEDIVRNAMNLDSNTQVTNAMMAQYLGTFNGQSSGSINTFQHNATDSGFQFVIPNTGNLTPGTHNTGDGNMNVQVTNQQIIWNFVYPDQ